ncbi:MAG: sigma-70 family RNA polymerase sigma factor [Verrucomicrobia bacterium]|nr:sigma-70 family RNA polymerase sigma factor [Verrucomicrobiota bacterium]
MSEVTRILDALDQGEPLATERLLPLVYDELRRLAASKMARESANHTLQPTALVHEAWMSLVDSPHQTWSNRAHFFGAAAEAMRRILIAHARRKQTLRRGSDPERVELDELHLVAPESEDQMLALSDALDRFAQLEPRQAELVKLRYFIGLTIEESAELLGISEATAKRWWAYARAWLFHELNP